VKPNNVVAVPIDARRNTLRGPESPWALLRNQAARALALHPSQLHVSSIFLGGWAYAQAVAEERLRQLHGRAPGARAMLDRSVPRDFAYVVLDGVAE
jgi:hypothetical protein